MDLISFLSRYGISKTTNFDLKDMSYDLGLDIKVIMRDEFISSIESTNKDLIIMNLQTTKDKGSHWVCIFKSPEDITSSDTESFVKSNTNYYDSWNIYFDPYGVLPTKEVLKVLPNIKYNETQVQPEGSEMCGQLSLYVLYRLNLGDDFETIISNFLL